jgi:protein-disulfide isomerase
MTRRNVALTIILLACLFGIGVGALLTWHHDAQLYGNAGPGELFGCTESAHVSCDAVNTSEWSALAGIPIGTWAIAAYAGVAAIAVMGLRGAQGALLPLWIAGGIAVACSAVLLYVSWVDLGFVCAWCLRLYAANLLIAVMAVVAGRPSGELSAREPAIAAATLGVVFAIAAGGEQAWRRSLLGPAAKEALKDVAPGELAGADPKGSAPERSFDVTTEDGHKATFSLSPDDAWRGDADSKVVVVEFGDLECGYCKRMNADLTKLYATYGDRVLFVWKHYPLNADCNPSAKSKMHRSACRAAWASECAKDQGHFWAFQDLTFKNQHQLGDDYLTTYAERAGADPDAFSRCLRDNSKLDPIRRDSILGGTLDIHGTPRIWIDGKLYRSGTSAEAMAKAIEAELGVSPGESQASTLHVQNAIPAIPADVPSMRPISDGDTPFSIDTFEDAVDASGKASSAVHQVPALRSSWYEAKAACEAAGKRLCTEQEWVTACQGAPAVDDNHNGQFADDMIEGNAYPYGDYHDDGRCWDGHDGGQAPDGTPWRPVFTGQMPGCATADGVYDMTGNLEEWVGETPEKAVLLGGAFDTSEDHARCYRRFENFGPGYSSVRSGFRCCK